MCERPGFLRAPRSALANGFRERNRAARHSQEQCRACRAQARALPSSEPSCLELDVALRGLYVLEQPIDDLFDRDSFRFRCKVRKHTMTKDRSRNTHDVSWRNRESSREERVSLRTEDERLTCTRTRSPSN